MQSQQLLHFFRATNSSFILRIFTVDSCCITACEKIEIRKLNISLKLLYIQSFLVLIMSLFGIYSLLPGVISLKSRIEILKARANEFHAIQWINNTIPKKSTLVPNCVLLHFKTKFFSN